MTSCNEDYLENDVIWTYPDEGCVRLDLNENKLKNGIVYDRSLAQLIDVVVLEFCLFKMK